MIFSVWLSQWDARDSSGHSSRCSLCNQNRFLKCTRYVFYGRSNPACISRFWSAHVPMPNRVEHSPFFAYLIAICGGNCGDRGHCMKPDTCMCSDGVQRFSCEEEDWNEMQSDQAVGKCLVSASVKWFCHKKLYFFYLVTSVVTKVMDRVNRNL